MSELPSKKLASLAQDIEPALSWLQAAIQCEAFKWDADQKDAALECLHEAEEAIKKMETPAPEPGALEVVTINGAEVSVPHMAAVEINWLRAELDKSTTPPPPPVHAEWCAAVAQIPGKCDCAAPPPLAELGPMTCLSCGGEAVAVPPPCVALMSRAKEVGFDYRKLQITATFERQEDFDELHEHLVRDYTRDAQTPAKWTCPVGHVQDHPMCPHCAEIFKQRNALTKVSSHE